MIINSIQLRLIKCLHASIVSIEGEMCFNPIRSWTDRVHFAQSTAFSRIYQIRLPRQWIQILKFNRIYDGLISALHLSMLIIEDSIEIGKCNWNWMLNVFHHAG